MQEHFSLWQERALSDVRAQDLARAHVHEFAQKNAEFLALCEISQSGPYHEEGPTVQAHIARALTMLFAVQFPEHSILNIDEWAALHEYRGFFLRLQETLAHEKSFLAAYILAHDIGKKDTAIEDAQGWHYPDHARRGADASYASFREAVLEYFGCSASEGKLLRELVRMHMEIIFEIHQKKETTVLSFALEMAKKQGLNVERFFALLPAVYFLDAIVGSLSHDREGFLQSEYMRLYAREEYRSFPERCVADTQREARMRKQLREQQLLKSGLGYEEWFVRLATPYGKERGRVVEILNRFIRGVEDEEDVRYVGNEHAHELRMKSAAFREEFEQKE